MSQDFIISDTRLKIDHTEFAFLNQSPIDLDIYYKRGGASHLKWICRLPKNSVKYVYPTVSWWKPGIILFAKKAMPLQSGATIAVTSYKDNFPAVFQPYTLKWMDHTVIWGEISIDFFHTKDIYSPRMDILSLVFNNHALTGYDIWYVPQIDNPSICGVKKREYLGRVQPYFVCRDKILYTLRSNNNSKYFQLKTWLEFRMEGCEKSQFIQLLHPATTDINIGVVQGRTELME